MRSLLSPSSYMLEDHGPSQQSCKEEYKPWKWGATARYYASKKRPFYQQVSPCQDPAGNRTTRRAPDHRKETQTEVVWTCLPFIRSGQIHLARHSERGKKTKQTEKRWEYNIRKWRGLEFAKSQRAVESKENWRKLVVKSSVVPQTTPAFKGQVRRWSVSAPPPPLTALRLSV